MCAMDSFICDTVHTGDKTHSYVPWIFPHVYVYSKLIQCGVEVKGPFFTRGLSQVDGHPHCQHKNESCLAQ